MKNFFRFLLGSVLAVIVCIEAYAIREWLFSEDCHNTLPRLHPNRYGPCALDKPFYIQSIHSDWCTDCNDLGSFEADNEWQAKKLDICPNREIVHKCGFYRSQLKICPEGYIREKNGSCTALNEPVLHITKKECANIPKHYWNRLMGYCDLKKDKK